MSQLAQCFIHLPKRTRLVWSSSSVDRMFAFEVSPDTDELTRTHSSQSVTQQVIPMLATSNTHARPLDPRQRMKQAGAVLTTSEAVLLGLVRDTAHTQYRCVENRTHPARAPRPLHTTLWFACTDASRK